MRSVFAGLWSVGVAFWVLLADCGRSYPVIAAQRRMLKAIAANMT